MNLEDLNALESGLSEYGLSLSDKQKNQFVTYGSMLQEWNQKMNLTAITDSEEIAVKHFLDSLTGIRLVDFSKVETLIDLGTGAGFPGIPLKIMFPEMKVTLADSLNKRINFLNSVIEQLELNIVTAVHGRAEDLARKPEYREQFDVCASRAVANLATLSEYCIPFVKNKGCFLSYKGPDADWEIREAKNAIERMGGRFENSDHFTLPPYQDERVLVLIRKEKPTPKKYPRQAGTPAKKPIQ
ncbi:MAG: 16S rRNA (guanine(527)-N(7))-methyltransferase RsmG [Lachnospiraceae bacterium]|nr:16S rRNA (guanine(527)-N(7))-methyltransferase RsmG [Lachnospiraceae bacterium]